MWGLLYVFKIYIVLLVPIRPSKDGELTFFLKSKPSYDANGNIVDLHRNGIRSIVTAMKEIDYQYDAMGNLIADVSEGISEISWNNSGKVSEITRSASNTPTLLFKYDALGNRIEKTVGYHQTTSSTNNKFIEPYKDRTWYIRDASGNIMATYSYRTNNQSAGIKLDEMYLYGSDRLGLLSIDQSIHELEVQPGKTGSRNYEIKNHLGNVLSTVSDRKTFDGTNFSSDILSATDYYAFGMQMQGRSFSSDGYRYGFQGQEKDDEVKGAGNSINYKYRMHDPRIGRFFSVDPLAPDYPHNSPYAFSENRVIDAIELEGLEAKLIITDNVIGYTPQHIYGSQSGETTIVVPVYSVILVDAQNPDVHLAYYGATRDAWYSRGVSSSGTELVNRAFEPADGNSNLYGSEPLAYPTSDLDAYALRRFGNQTLKAEPFTQEQNTYLDGTPIDDARENLDEANGVMFHIGGYYNNGSYDKLAGSYGCFGFICQDQIYGTQADAQKVVDDGNVGMNGTTNQEYKQAINKIVDVKNNTSGEKTVHITVEKRTNVDKTKTVQ